MPSCRLSALSGACATDDGGPGGEAAQSARRIAITSGVAADFAVAIRLARVGGPEEETGPRGGEPRPQELRRPRPERLAEPRPHPTADVARLGRTPSPHRHHPALPLPRSPEE